MSYDVQRRSVDLTAYPDLVVVYLGFRINRLRGVLSLLRLRAGLVRLQRSHPDGLLLHESVVYGLRHFGMRQYWRDLAALEQFTRSDPHRAWWREFAKDSGGAGFWHETYQMRGGMEALYIDMQQPTGFAAFAPPLAPVGPFQTARGRLAASEDATRPPVASARLSG